MPAQQIHAHARPQGAAGAASSSASASISAGPLHSTLPSQETQRHVEEARSAVIASIGNMLDSELQTRASILHDNAAALDKQEMDVLRATEGLRRERERLAREADAAARRVKELGNVQNWAEVLERGFLVLEETVRLANGGTDDEDDGDGGTCSCSCSDCGNSSSDDDRDGGDDDDHGDRGQRNDQAHDGQLNGGINGHIDMDVDRNLSDNDEHKFKPPGMDVDMMSDVEGGLSNWSDASRSLTEADSSTETGRAKGSETASISTTS